MTNPSAIEKRRWFLSVAGLGLIVFAIVALSGPGRIDIVDGQTRFEVGRSLLEHGDSIVRDERVTWGIFPGSAGQRYTLYRIPQSLAAAGAIAVADLTGPAAEGREHFFFVLTSAVTCAFLAMFYAVWFRDLGLSPLSSLFWALGGIVCTPSWYYGTSTFDDILGTTAVVSAVVVAFRSRNRSSFFGALVAGLLVGIAYNCKQPLGAFALLVLAAQDSRSKSKRERIIRTAIVAAGLFAGVLFEKMYDWCKYPFDRNVVHQELLAAYVPIWSDNPLPAFLCLIFSPGAGAVWYCPPLFIMLAGLVAWRRDGESRMVWAMSIGVGVFVGFICMLTFFKGDLSWGPRYLTPLYALGWLFVPAGAKLLRRSWVILLLGSGFLVQLLALSVDPHRLFVWNRYPSGIGAINPLIYFDPSMNQILQRPKEIWQISTETKAAEQFTPSPSPTFALPIADPFIFPEYGPEGVRRYRVLDWFRPWWTSQQFLPPSQRPVAIGSTVGLLGAILTSGVLLVGLGTGIGRATRAVKTPIIPPNGAPSPPQPGQGA